MYKYYHATKGCTGDIRLVDLIDDTSHIEYDCIIYHQDLECEAGDCEIFKDTDGDWKVRIKQTTE